MPLYRITPSDVLMFRDGRPIEPLAGSGAHGARWPEPSIVFDALHAALHRAFPHPQDWEQPHRYGRSSDRDSTRPATQRFGSLATAGPFPMRGDEWWFPVPLDITRPGEFNPGLLPLPRVGGADDLEAPLTYVLGSRLPASKEPPRPWWNKAAWDSYLHGAVAPGSSPAAFKEEDVFVREGTIGIAIGAENGTVAPGQIYSAEYLRLDPAISLGICATMPGRNAVGSDNEEQFTQLLGAQRTIIVGGQQRSCQVEPFERSLPELLPTSAPITGERVKYILLSPAVYPEISPTSAKPDAIPHRGGWLPNWVAEGEFHDPQGRQRRAGEVLLKQGDTTRRPGEGREKWRQRIRSLDYLDCRLVAARIPKPLVLTGWTERLHLASDPGETDDGRKRKGPRPTLLAVPAGSVYYFEGPDAARLAEALAWHGSSTENPHQTRIVNRRSTLLGEQGFGVGVCGPWSPFPGVPAAAGNLESAGDTETAL